MDYNQQIQEIKQNIEQAKSFFYSQKGKMEQIQEQKSSLEVQLQKAIDNIDLLEQVRLLLQKTSDFAREQARQKIEALVTHCLQFIFETPIEFKIEINELRGRQEAEFYVVSNINGESIKTKPQEARGGGVVDIISLAIRIAMLGSSSIDLDGPIILDEPAKHVSDEYIAGVAEFLKQVSTTFKRQVIMVTHNRHLSEVADKAFKVEMIEGRSIVEN
jgi:DNA repair exonuclease SbcCD ATPase subunit